MDTFLIGTAALTALMAAGSLVLTVLINLRVSAVHAEQRNDGEKLTAVEEASGRGNTLVQLELASARNESAKNAKQLREELLIAFATLAETVKATSPSSQTSEHQFSVLAECLSQMKADNANNAATLREEVLGLISQALALAQSGKLDGTSQQIASLLDSNEQQLDALRQSVDARLSELRSESSANANLLREEVSSTLQAQVQVFAEQVTEKLAHVASAIRDQANRSAQQETVRLTVEASLAKFQSESEVKIEQICAMFDERMQSRLAELQLLMASGDGDTIVRPAVRRTTARGTLGAILEQILAREQFEKDVEVRPGTGECVDYAVKLPNPAGSRWLPLAAQFPREDYDRLIDASMHGDVEAAETAAKALEAQVRIAAKSLCENHVQPPLSADFAVLFVPLEGLYSEVARRPGLVDELQRDYCVVLAGPTALTALLNGIKAGFRAPSSKHRNSTDESSAEGGARSPDNVSLAVSRARLDSRAPRPALPAPDVSEAVTPPWASQCA